jgi:hypothetical protein
VHTGLVSPKVGFGGRVDREAVTDEGRLCANLPLEGLDGVDVMGVLGRGGDKRRGG